MRESKLRAKELSSCCYHVLLLWLCTPTNENLLLIMAIIKYFDYSFFYTAPCKAQQERKTDKKLFNILWSPSVLCLKSFVVLSAVTISSSNINIVISYFSGNRSLHENGISAIYKFIEQITFTDVLALVWREVLIALLTGAVGYCLSIEACHLNTLETSWEGLMEMIQCSIRCGHAKWKSTCWTRQERKTKWENWDSMYRVQVEHVQFHGK